jgi:hypothetical protein
MCSRDYIASLLLLRDNLPQLSRLSKFFQDPNADWSVLEIELPVLLEHIEGQIEKPGPHYSKLSEFLQVVEDAGLEVRCVAGRGEDWLEVNRVQYLRSLGDHLRARFPCVPLLSALFRLFNAHQFPAESDQLLTFGEDLLGTVLAHYATCGVVDEKATKLEWPTVRKWLSGFRGKKKMCVMQVPDTDVAWDTSEEQPMKTIEQERNVPIGDILEEFLNNETLTKLSPMFVRLFVIYLVLTKDSSDCERGFSVMKRIKTVMRNRLVQSTLEQLMYISLNGPDLKDFDFHEAVLMFVNSGKRLLKTSLESEKARSAAIRLDKTTWGSAVPDEYAEAEAERDLGRADFTRVFTGTAPVGDKSVQKRKDAAVFVQEKKKKSRHEENRQRVNAIVQENVEADSSAKEQFAEEVGGETCTVCNLTFVVAQNMMLLCDGTDCENAVHQLCHEPPLDIIPAGKWFCQGCDAKMDRSQRGRRIIPKIPGS